MILSLQEYFWISTTRMYLMYKLHRYEFKRHRYRLLGLSTAILFSLVYVVMGVYSVTLVVTCIESEIKILGEDHMNDLCYQIFHFSTLTPSQAD